MHNLIPRSYPSDAHGHSYSENKGMPNIGTPLLDIMGEATKASIKADAAASLFPEKDVED